MNRILEGFLAGAGAAVLVWWLRPRPTATAKRHAAEAGAGEAARRRRYVSPPPEAAPESAFTSAGSGSVIEEAPGGLPVDAEHVVPLLDLEELEVDPLPEFSRSQSDEQSRSRAGILSPAERDSAGREAPTSGRLALIADDDADIRALAAQLLERAGFDVVTAADGDEALRLALDREPSICVLDWMMPRRSGLDVLESLRSGAATRSTPVLLLTARAGANDIERGISAGADGYLAKPFTADQLRERVLELVDLHAA